MLWTPADDSRVEQRLRELVAGGQTFDEAIRALHRQDRVGTLFLCRAAERVSGLVPREAKRLVVRALSTDWHG